MADALIKKLVIVSQCGNCKNHKIQTTKDKHWHHNYLLDFSKKICFQCENLYVTQQTCKNIIRNLHNKTCCFYACETADIWCMLIRQVAVLRLFKDVNINYRVVFTIYFWLCSCWDFWNRAPLHENIMYDFCMRLFYEKLNVVFLRDTESILPNTEM